ncbi:DUF5615 family PIN-like protein [Propionivibrio sp.]|uniref:DUF5615 family PIN-like protein n=1 Tax=Propionivibrio sp. TaxID=2212460 RepID=UPI00263466A4|nr:DUF5615 family PIN-like protein [Propionivibrio sp.]
MKLLVDMNLSPRWVKVLSDAGVEAAHWSSLGAILAATHGDKPSVVQIRAEDVSPDVIGTQVVAALQQMTVELEEGALITVDPNRTRLHVLPLQPRS